MSDNIRTYNPGDTVYFDSSNEMLTVNQGFIDIFILCLKDSKIVNKQISLGQYKAGDSIFCFSIISELVKNDEECSYRIIGRINHRVEIEARSYSQENEFYKDIASGLNSWLLSIFSLIGANYNLENVKYITSADAAFDPGQILSSNSLIWIKRTEKINIPEIYRTYLLAEKSEFLPLSPLTVYPATSEGEAELIDTLSLLGRFGLDFIESIFLHFYCQLESLYKSIFNIEKARYQSHFENKERDLLKCADQVRSIMSEEDLFSKEIEGETSEIFEAISLVAKQYGIELKKNKEQNFNTVADYVKHIGRENNFFVRQTRLPDRWWLNPGLPFLTFDRETSEPIAVIVSRGRYYQVNMATRKKERVNGLNASKLHTYGFSMHPVLNSDKVSLKDFVKLILLGNRYNISILLITGVIMALMGAVMPVATNLIISEGIYYSDITFTMNILLLLIFFSVGAIFFETVSGLCMGRIDTRAGIYLQGAIIDRLFKMPLQFFKKYSAGDLADRAFGISSIQHALISANVSSVLGLIFAAVSLFMMFYYSIELALIGFVIAVVSALLSFVYTMLTYKYVKKETELGGEISGLTYQIFNGLAKLKLMDREALGLSKWGSQYSVLAKNSYKSSKLGIKLGVISGGFNIITTIVIYSVVGETLMGPNPIQVPAFFAFMSAYGQFSGSLSGFVGIISKFITLRPTYRRIKPILETAPEISEDSLLHSDLQGNIEIHNLNFRYSEESPYIFKNLNMKINPGEFIAIVGESGSGKSTLSRLMLGIEKPETGAVFYDGYNISDINIRELRRSIGVVNQNAKIMPGSIYENITGGGEYSKEEAWWAASLAGLHEEIASFPMHMETVIPEGGGSFSGGQIQRMIIARALIKRPGIVILDEATSALDNKTQQVITNNLNQMRITRIVIAHRLSTIKSADRIFVLKDGSFAETGTYDELMEKEGIFYNFASRQLV